MKKFGTVLLAILLLVASGVIFVCLYVEIFTPRYTDTAHYEIIFNEYRQSQGREPLIFTDDLNCIASLRLEEVKNDYSHSSQGDYNKYFGENIVNNIRSNEEALKSWQGSWLHDANMLDSDCRYTGYAAGDGYAVQLFSEWVTINGIPQLPPGWHFDY